MRHVVLWSVVALGLGSASFADEASHRAAAMRVIEASLKPDAIEQTLEMVDSMMVKQFESMNLPAGSRDEIERTQREVWALMEGVLTWDNMAEFMVSTYVDLFSEAELEDLAAFYASPLGQKLIDQQPEIAGKTMMWTQTKLQEVMPEIQRISTESFQRIQRAQDGEEADGN